MRLLVAEATRPLEGEIAGTVGVLVESGKGTLALDPSRGEGLEEAAARYNAGA